MLNNKHQRFYNNEKYTSSIIVNKLGGKFVAPLANIARAMKINKFYRSILILIITFSLITALFANVLSVELFNEKCNECHEHEYSYPEDQKSCFKAGFPILMKQQVSTLSASHRNSQVIGKLITPGSYNDSLNPSTKQIDFYTIYLNGTGGNTDLIEINVTASSHYLGAVSFASPDLFVIKYGYYNETIGNCSLSEYAIATGYHYIAVGIVNLSGGFNYWLNITVTKTTNNKNDANNDFTNSTIAIDDDSLSESLNYTYDYWDIFYISIQPNNKLTLTGDPIDTMDIRMLIFDAPNSSFEHELADVDDGWGGEKETYEFDTNSSVVVLYVCIRFDRIIPKPDPKQGNYYLNVSIDPLNQPPYIDLTDPNLNLWYISTGITVNEDEVGYYKIKLSEHFADDGNPTIPGRLKYSYSCSSIYLDVSIHLNSSVTFTPAPNWFGSNIEITFFADDSELNVSDTINVTINPVNDPPQLTNDKYWFFENGSYQSNIFEIWEGVQCTIKVSASDPDEDNPVPDQLYYSADLHSRGDTQLYDLPMNFYLGEETGVIIYTPENEDVGTFYVNITVRDRKKFTSDPGHYDWLNVTFRIKNTNEPPEFTKIVVKGKQYEITSDNMVLPPKAQQDSEFFFEIYADDIDFNVPGGDTLTFSIEPKSLFTQYESTNGDMAKFSFTPNNDMAMKGFITAYLTVRDSIKKSDWLTLTIWIQNLNDPPKFYKVNGEFIQDKKLMEFTDELALDPYDKLEFVVEANDIDINDSLTFSSTNLTLIQGFSPELKIVPLTDNRTAEIIFDPLAKRANSTVWINLTVSDSGYPSYSDWFNVIVEILPEPVELQKYTLTSADCAKSYTDNISDVFIYDYKSDGSIKSSKGGFESIDIVSIESEQRQDQLIIIVRFANEIDISNIGTLTQINLYLVKNSFLENGVHLNPKKVDKTDWKALPFQPEAVHLIGGKFFDYFEIHVIDNPYYSSSFEGYSWKVAINMQDFERNFYLNKDNKNFELFAISYDYSKLIFESGDLSNPLGPKAYDSAGFGAAPAPKPNKDTPIEDGGGILGDEDSNQFMLIGVVIIFIIIILIVLFLFFIKRKQKLLQAQDQSPPQAEQTASPTTTGEVTTGEVTTGQLICENCLKVLQPQEIQCTNCGTVRRTSSSQKRLYCNRCGAFAQAGQYRCQRCGTYLSTEDTQDETPLSLQEPSQPQAPSYYRPQDQPPQYPEPEKQTLYGDDRGGYQQRPYQELDRY